MKISPPFRFVKIVVFVDLAHAQIVRKAMAEAGAGKLGNYDSCSFSTKGMGRFRPNEKAKPFLGKRGKVSKAREEKIEMLCRAGRTEKVIKAIRKIHPYEEPAIEIYPLLYP